jgi:hypothetical protein
MVLDKEYGEFEMLNIEIVKLVEEFDGFRNPNIDSLNSYKEEGQSISDLWEEQGIQNYYESRVLNQEEQKKLTELLLTDRNEDHFRAVSSYIRWATNNLDWQEDLKDCLRHSDEYDHFILGREIGGGCHSDWCKSSIGRISFFSKYYSDQYFEKMLPHYIESLRRLLVEAPTRTSQQEAA